MLPASIIERVKNNEDKFTRVNLASNSLFKQSVEESTNALVDALKQNTFVTEVDVSECGINNAGAQLFADLLKTNTTIQKLDLSNNRLDSLGQEILFEALKENNTLEELKLLGNERPGEGCLTKLIDTFEYNTSLKNIVWRLESRQSFKINACITRNKEIERRKKLGKSIDDIDPNIRRETERRVLEERANGIPSTVVAPKDDEITEAPPATGGPYPLRVLQSKFIPSDVDHSKKEDYLSDDEFKSVFKITKDEFAKSPQWKRKNLKKDANLF